MMQFEKETEIRILRKNSLQVGDEIKVDINLYVMVLDILSSSITQSLKYDYRIKVINVMAKC